MAWLAFHVDIAFQDTNWLPIFVLVEDDVAIIFDEAAL